MPVRVAFCITELDPGGAERALAEIVTRLPPAEWMVRVYCLGPETELSRRLCEQGVETVCLGAVRSSQIGVVLWRLARSLREYRPAILQTFLFHANLIGRLAAWWAGVPVVLSGVRVAERSRRWHLWLDRWTNGFVRFNVCVSESVREFSQTVGGLPAAKMRVIPNGVDRERFQQARQIDLAPFGIPADSTVLVAIGRLTHQKGFDVLIEAVAPLLRQESNWHLLIVGEGEQRAQLEELANRFEVSTQVHLAGWQRDVAGILKSSDLFVMSSRWEGMPNVLLEAMSSGVPMIATDVEGVRELLSGEKKEKLVIPGDVKALRRAVTTAMDGASAENNCLTQHDVVERHTWTTVANKYGQLFMSCLREVGEFTV